MKQPIKLVSRIAKVAPLAFYILLMVAVCGAGCVSPTPDPDPLTGWHFSSLVNLQSDKAISDDCHTYINALPPKLKAGIGPMQYFEDETGQHAVLIEIAQNGTDWGHLLIYDTEGKRIKVIKYVRGRYAC